MALPAGSGALFITTNAFINIFPFVAHRDHTMTFTLNLSYFHSTRSLCVIYFFGFSYNGRTFSLPIAKCIYKYQIYIYHQSGNLKWHKGFSSSSVGPTPEHIPLSGWSSGAGRAVLITDGWRIQFLQLLPLIPGQLEKLPVMPMALLSSL